MMMMMMMMTTTLVARVVLRLRIANQVVMDSRCRGGIVNSRCGCSSALVERRDSPKALWRFRVSTSNSPSGRTWLHPYTQIHRIDQIYAQPRNVLLKKPISAAQEAVTESQGAFFLRKYLIISR